MTRWDWGVRRCSAVGPGAEVSARRSERGASGIDSDIASGGSAASSTPFDASSTPSDASSKPPTRRVSPPTRRASPRTRRASPRTRRASPRTRRASPLTRRASPPTRRASPPTRRASPPARRALASLGPESPPTSPNHRTTWLDRFLARRAEPRARRAAATNLRETMAALAGAAPHLRTRGRSKRSSAESFDSLVSARSSGASTSRAPIADGAVEALVAHPPAQSARPGERQAVESVAGDSREGLAWTASPF